MFKPLAESPRTPPSIGSQHQPSSPTKEPIRKPVTTTPVTRQHDGLRHHSLPNGINSYAEKYANKPSSFVVPSAVIHERTNTGSPPSPGSPHSPNSPVSLSNKPNKQVNIIKLEVVNSKKSNNGEKSSSPSLEKQHEKSIGFSKPPLPPTGPNPSTYSIGANTSSTWRSKLKPNGQAQLSDEKEHEKSPDLSEPKSAFKSSLINKNVPSSNSDNKNPPTAPKPSSRIIPLEIKNTKNGTVTVVSSKTPNNAKDTKERVSEKEKPIPSPLTLPNNNSNVNDRPRSTSTYRPIETSTNLDSPQSRNTTTFSYFRDPSPTSTNTRPSVYSDYRRAEAVEPVQNTYLDLNTPVFQQEPRKLDYDGPDPIAEKACNNFMFKLMEFQRQNKPAVGTSSSPYDKTLSSSTYDKPLTSSSTYDKLLTSSSTYDKPLIGSSSAYDKPLLTASSLSASPVTSYQGPIISARTSNSNLNINHLASSSTNLTNNPITQSSYSSIYTGGGYTSPFTSSRYSATTPTTATTTPSFDYPKYSPSFNLNSSSLYANDLNSNSHEPGRPYVSAIRKRRTLFNENEGQQQQQQNHSESPNLFENSSNYFNYQTPYTTSEYNIGSYLSNDASKSPLVSGFSTNRQRPLSIVNEENRGENNSSTLARSLSAKEAHINDTKSKLQIKKSNSINTSRQESSGGSSSGSSSPTTPPPSSSAFSAPSTKIRASVFDRLTSVNNNNNNINNLNSAAATPPQNSATLNASKLRSNLGTKNNSSWQLNLDSEKPKTNTQQKVVETKPANDFGIKNVTTVIKDQNDIAIVTSVTKPRETLNNSPSQQQQQQLPQTFNRIRSLDSKSREKLKEKTASLTTNATQNSATTSVNVNSNTLTNTINNTTKKVNVPISPAPTGNKPPARYSNYTSVPRKKT